MHIIERREDSFPSTIPMDTCRLPPPPLPDAPPQPPPHPPPHPHQQASTSNEPTFPATASISALEPSLLHVRNSLSHDHYPCHSPPNRGGSTWKLQRQSSSKGRDKAASFPRRRTTAEKENSRHSGSEDDQRATSASICRCAVGLTADCAAVCCCPFALLHLLALVFIKLPSTAAWRILTSIRKKWSKTTPLDPQEQEKHMPSFTPSSSHTDSPEGENNLTTIVRLDSQKLLKQFETGHLGFGGIPIRKD